MPNQGEAKTPGQKRMLYNWGGSMLGVIVGSLVANPVFGHAMNNAPLATVLGAVLGGIIGFGAPDIFRLVSHRPN